MRTKVNVESQVESFVKSLAPEPRRRLRMAMKDRAKNGGDIKRLEGRLEGYSRLRVSGHRVIFAERAQPRSRRVHPHKHNVQACAGSDSLRPMHWARQSPARC